MKFAQDIVIAPVITERSMTVARERKYTFRVAKDANKIEIKKAVEEGIVKREDVFVTSKIMPGDYERAAQGINDSLHDLGLESCQINGWHTELFTDENANKWNTHFTLEKLGLPESTGKTLEMKNLWTGETTVIKNGVFFKEIEPHDCLLFRAKVIDK